MLRLSSAYIVLVVGYAVAMLFSGREATALQEVAGQAIGQVLFLALLGAPFGKLLLVIGAPLLVIHVFGSIYQVLLGYEMASGLLKVTKLFMLLGGFIISIALIVSIL